MFFLPGRVLSRLHGRGEEVEHRVGEEEESDAERGQHDEAPAVSQMATHPSIG